MYAFEYKPQHKHDVDKIYCKYKSIVKLSRSELRWCEVVKNVTEEPISKGKHRNMDGKEEESWWNKG